jgi:DNA-binding PadR family transcriptional regulator
MKKTRLNIGFHYDIAKELGVDCAIMHANIEYWVAKNEANGKNLYQGSYWTFNSYKAFTRLFPFWTDAQVRRILKSLEKAGYIKSSNMNKKKYDRTKWYTICQNQQMDLSELANGVDRIDAPIPNIKPNIKHTTSTQGVGEGKVDDNDEPMDLRTFADEYIERDKDKYRDRLAAWAEATNPNLVTKGQWRAFIKRNIRTARLLDVFTNEQIRDAYETIMKDSSNGTKFSPTLETIYKYLTR